MKTIAAPKPTTGERAIRAAQAAGFVIVKHRPYYGYGYYSHNLEHADGRTFTLYTELGTGRFLRTAVNSRGGWRTRKTAVRSVPALERLLAL